MVKITSKGQLTLPVDIRRKLDIQAGDEVDVEIVDEESAELKITRRPSLLSLFGILETEKEPHEKSDVRKQIGRDLGERIQEDEGST